MIDFVVALENEGILGLAQATVAQASNNAVSFAGRLLKGNCTNEDNDGCEQLAVSEPTRMNCDDDGAPFVLKIALTMARIMLGAISPILPPMILDIGVNEGCKAHHNGVVSEKKCITSEADTVFSGEYYDADCCHGSLYFDATSSTYTSSTASHTSSSPMDEVSNEKTVASVPKSVFVREVPKYYLDFSSVISKVDEDTMPCSPEEVHDERFYALDDSTESFNHVLELLVETSIRIAEVDTASSGSELLCWKPDGHTRRLLNSHNDTNSADWTYMLENEVLKWTSSWRNDSLLRTQGIVNISAEELKNLLIDPKRVHLFNKNNRGKDDVHTFSSVKTGDAKIVRSILNIPFLGTMTTLSLTHSRCMGKDGFIIVSHSANHLAEAVANPYYSFCILSPVPNSNKTGLINVAQSASMPIPKFLMHKVGAQCAMDFFNNLRSLA